MQLHDYKNEMQSPPVSNVDELSRIFNSAMVATQPVDQGNPTTELFELMQSAPFRAIMEAVQQLARSEGVSEREASEQIIRAFRKVDRIWSGYVFKEGLDKLRGHIGNA